MQVFVFLFFFESVYILLRTGSRVQLYNCPQLLSVWILQSYGALEPSVFSNAVARRKKAGVVLVGSNFVLIAFYPLPSPKRFVLPWNFFWRHAGMEREAWQKTNKANVTGTEGQFSLLLSFFFSFFFLLFFGLFIVGKSFGAGLHWEAPNKVLQSDIRCAGCICIW